MSSSTYNSSISSNSIFVSSSGYEDTTSILPTNKQSTNLDKLLINIKKIVYNKNFIWIAGTILFIGCILIYFKFKTKKNNIESLNKNSDKYDIVLNNNNTHELIENDLSNDLLNKKFDNFNQPNIVEKFKNNVNNNVDNSLHNNVNNDINNDVSNDVSNDVNNDVNNNVNNDVNNNVNNDVNNNVNNDVNNIVESLDNNVENNVDSVNDNDILDVDDILEEISEDSLSDTSNTLKNTELTSDEINAINTQLNNTT